MQHRTFDSLGCFLVGVIMVDIDRGRRSILLANSMNAGGITVSRNVLFENLGPKRTLPEWIFEHGIGGAEQIALWQPLFLREQNPGPIRFSESRIRSVPRFKDRNYVEYSEPLYRPGVVQSQ